MTQAFNLAQLANAVDTSGRLNVGTNATGTLPLANGGTGTTNTVNTVVAGTGISVSTSGTQVTVTNTSSASGTVTSVATGNGLQGGTITSTGTLSVAAPAANTVGSWAFVRYVRNYPGSGATAQGMVFGSDYAVGTGQNQMQLQALTPDEPAADSGNQISGTWRWFGRQLGTNSAMTVTAIGCRVS